jgi:membrane-associated phospholipid phosphatase
MYLGVHFLADILSGYIVGGVMLLCFYRVVIHPKALSRYLKTDKYGTSLNHLPI